MYLLTTEDDGLRENHPGDTLGLGFYGQRAFVGVVALRRLDGVLRPREQRACRDIGAGVGLPQ